MKQVLILLITMISLGNVISQESNFSNDFSVSYRDNYTINEIGDAVSYTILGCKNKISGDNCNQILIGVLITENNKELESHISLLFDGNYFKAIEYDGDEELSQIVAALIFKNLGSLSDSRIRVPYESQRQNFWSTKFIVKQSYINDLATRISTLFEKTFCCKYWQYQRDKKEFFSKISDVGSFYHCEDKQEGYIIIEDHKFIKINRDYRTGNDILAFSSETNKCYILKEYYNSECNGFAKAKVVNDGKRYTIFKGDNEFILFDQGKLISLEDRCIIKTKGDHVFVFNIYAKEIIQIWNLRIFQKGYYSSEGEENEFDWENTVFWKKKDGDFDVVHNGKAITHELKLTEIGDDVFAFNPANNQSILLDNYNNENEGTFREAKILSDKAKITWFKLSDQPDDYVLLSSGKDISKQSISYKYDNGLMVYDTLDSIYYHLPEYSTKSYNEFSIAEDKIESETCFIFKRVNHDSVSITAFLNGNQITSNVTLSRLGQENVIAYDSTSQYTILFNDLNKKGENRIYSFIYDQNPETILWSHDNKKLFYKGKFLNMNDYSNFKINGTHVIYNELNKAYYNLNNEEYYNNVLSNEIILPNEAEKVAISIVDKTILNTDFILIDGVNVAGSCLSFKSAVSLRNRALPLVYDKSSKTYYRFKKVSEKNKKLSNSRQAKQLNSRYFSAGYRFADSSFIVDTGYELLKAGEVIKNRIDYYDYGSGNLIFNTMDSLYYYEPTRNYNPYPRYFKPLSINIMRAVFVPHNRGTNDNYNDYEIQLLFDGLPILHKCTIMTYGPDFYAYFPVSKITYILPNFWTNRSGIVEAFEVYKEKKPSRKILRKLTEQRKHHDPRIWFNKDLLD